MGKNNRKRRNTVDSNTFFVEKILNKRVNADNEIEYFIKWKGFNDDWNTWEPAGNCNCKALIDAYDEEHSNVKFESLQEDNTVAAKKIKVESGLCNPSASVMIKVSPDETGIVTGAVFVPSSSSTSIDINESTNFGDNNAEHKQVFEASSTVKKCDVELSSSPCASLEATKNAVASEKALSTNADPLSRESNSVVVPLIPVTPFEDGAKQSTSTNERVDK
uniref:Chromo domain-containing protein n=1 Tax=Panagrolaimus sp. ES5 TaxID=591445 RepID=A0AC34F1I7_9BILA